MQTLRVLVLAITFVAVFARGAGASQRESEIHGFVLPGEARLSLRVVDGKAGLRIQTGRLRRGRFIVSHQALIVPFVKGEAFVRPGYACDHISEPTYQPYIILATEIFTGEQYAEVEATAIRAWAVDTRTGRIDELPGSMVSCRVPQRGRV